MKISTPKKFWIFCWIKQGWQESRRIYFFSNRTILCTTGSSWWRKTATGSWWECRCTEEDSLWMIPTTTGSMPTPRIRGVLAPTPASPVSSATTRFASHQRGHISSDVSVSITCILFIPYSTILCSNVRWRGTKAKASRSTGTTSSRLSTASSRTRPLALLTNGSPMKMSNLSKRRSASRQINCISYVS